jgi:hypothetical protein
MTFHECTCVDEDLVIVDIATEEASGTRVYPATGFEEAWVSGPGEAFLSIRGARQDANDRLKVRVEAA